MKLRSTHDSELEQDINTLKALGELLDAADARLLSMEAAYYDSTRAQAKALIETYAFQTGLESWCEDSWALMDLFEEVMVGLERTCAPVIELRPLFR